MYLNSNLLSKHIAALYESNQDNHNSDDEKNVNKTAHGVRTD